MTQIANFFTFLFFVVMFAKPCAGNGRLRCQLTEHWDLCPSCDATCEVPHQTCARPVPCPPPRCMCKTGYVRHGLVCITLTQCPQTALGGLQGGYGTGIGPGQGTGIGNIGTGYGTHQGIGYGSHNGYGGQLGGGING